MTLNPFSHGVTETLLFLISHHSGAFDFPWAPGSFPSDFQLVLLVGIVKLYSKIWSISVSLRNPTPSPNLTILCCLYSAHYGCWVGDQGNLCSRSFTPHVCVNELCAYMRGIDGHIAYLYSPETHTQSSCIRCVRICVLYIKWRYGLRTLNVTD